MNRRLWASRLLKLITSVAMGSTVIGTSCGQDLRNTLRSVGLDFIKSTASTALEELIPVEDMLQAE